jgi:hypothetical protein
MVGVVFASGPDVRQYDRSAVGLVDVLLEGGEVEQLHENGRAVA